MAQILKVDDIHVYYGSIHAVKGVSFEVNEGEVVTLIGANGAGKSTILNTISGLLHPKMRQRSSLRAMTSRASRRTRSLSTVWRRSPRDAASSSR